MTVRCAPQRAMRAFSLIEAFVAIAIASIIATAGAMAVTHINYQIQDTKKRALAWDSSKRLQEFLISRMQGAGGGVLRPYQAIKVSNNIPCLTAPGLPACDGSDRVELMHVSTTLPQCRTTGTSGVNINVDDNLLGDCCLDVVGPDTFEGTYAVLVSDTGVVQPIYLQTRTGACSINAPVGLGNNPTPPVLAGATPGMLVAVNHEMLFVNRATQRMYMWRDANGDRAATAIELTELGRGVYDLQLAYGYDGNPVDGRVTDLGNDLDEWRFNHPADPLLGAVGTPFEPVSEDQLRMVQVGVTVGVKARLGANVAVQLLDGPPVPADPTLYYAITASKAYLRNVSVFQ